MVVGLTTEPDAHLYLVHAPEPPAAEHDLLGQAGAFPEADL